MSESVVTSEWGRTWGLGGARVVVALILAPGIAFVSRPVRGAVSLTAPAATPPRWSVLGGVAGRAGAAVLTGAAEVAGAAGRDGATDLAEAAGLPGVALGL